jgi:hypothetical protein
LMMFCTSLTRGKSFWACGSNSQIASSIRGGLGAKTPKKSKNKLN